MEHAVESDGYFFTRAPWLDDDGQLFALGWEQQPVDDAATAARLAALLDAWDRKAPPRRDDRMQPATEQALRSLGYVE